MKQRSFEIREFYGGPAATPKMDFGPYQSGVDGTLKRKRSAYLTTMTASKCTGS